MHDNSKLTDDKHHKWKNLMLSNSIMSSKGLKTCMRETRILLCGSKLFLGLRLRLQTGAIVKSFSRLPM